MKILENCINEAAKVLAEINKHPLVRKVTVDADTETIYLNVYTHPIILKNPYGVGTLPLGCMIIRIESNRDFEILVDTSVPDSESGRSKYLGDKIHPHVRRGYVCMGSAGDIVDKILQMNDIPIFITFIIEFLKTYDHRNAYWLPWFKEPCDECGKYGTDACKWCACNGCSLKISDNCCSGCERWMKESAGVAARSIQDEINHVRQNIDEDEFIELAKAIAELLKR